MSNVSKSNINVEYLPIGKFNPKFEQRESGVLHTPYKAEVACYSCIRDGEVESLSDTMRRYFGDTLFVGRMSRDDLRQTKYFGVACITLATRYAIEGGVDEMEAYNLSDESIQHIDALNSAQDIFEYLTSKAKQLTLLVRANRQKMEYAPFIRKALKYIGVHLHERIRLDDVAAACGVSASYLSAEFSKAVGKSVSQYVMLQKLEESKTLLDGEHKYGEIGYYFGFCSQTHYITCFKKQFGVTPKEYMQKHTLE